MTRRTDQDLEQPLIERHGSSFAAQGQPDAIIVATTHQVNVTSRGPSSPQNASDEPEDLGDHALEVRGRHCLGVEA